MATVSNVPGVYVEDVSTPVLVTQVATAIPVFIGYTETHYSPLEPFRITSLKEYEQRFGGPFVESFVANFNADGVFDSLEIQNPSGFKTYYSVRHYFANGGGPCYVLSVASYSSAANVEDTLAQAIEKLQYLDEATIVLIPDAMKIDTAENAALFYKDVLAEVADLGDKFLLIDLHSDELGDPIADFKDSIGTENLKYAAAYFPFLNSAYSFVQGNTKIKITIDGISYTSGKQPSIQDWLNRAIGVVSGDPDIEESLDQFPSFLVPNSTRLSSLTEAINSKVLVVPPSGAIAGIYAKTDDERGVWKAPANVVIKDVTGPTYRMNEIENGDLNVDPSTGKSINAIKFFPGKGTMVWGARTLDGNSNEWRYVPVRRLFNTIEESIKKSIDYAVFETNDANTWQRLKATIENYFISLFRQGAFAGNSNEEAFFVNIGLNSSMTSQDVLEGRLIIHVGIAAVRPAEFITMRFTHQLQTS